MINIASIGDELLETRLNEATNPLNLSLNVDATDAFCDQVLKEPEGCQIAVRLLAHKVQSPQEKEAMYSFAVIDECVKKCGPRFHQEIGKFRFLNELIKVISPKYLALNMSPAVKKRCIECLYGLYKGIPHEPKLTEAYNMLKKQHIITKDPTYMDEKIFKVLPATTDRAKNIFETSKDSERLTKLLKSRNPDDLREANRIIKNVVQQDNNRIEQMSKRQMELETMRTNIELLGDMLTHYVADERSADDLVIMKELVDNLEKSRSEMFKLSRETDDDECLNDIIKVIDECNVIIKCYWDKMATTKVSDSVKAGGHPPEGNLIGEDLLGDSLECDLLATDLHSIGIHDSDSLNAAGTAASTNVAPITKYDELMNLFHSQNSSELITPINGKVSANHSTVTDNHKSNDTPISSNCSGVSKNQNTVPNRTTKIEFKGFEDLDILSKEFFNLSKKTNGGSFKSELSQDVELLSSLEDKLGKDPLCYDTPLLCSNLGVRVQSDSNLDGDSTSPALDTKGGPRPEQPKTEAPTVDLSDFNISLSSIKPHPLKLPITVYSNSESKVKLILHFASDRPHPKVSVMVAQISSQNVNPVTDIVLKFAAPKPMRIRKLTGTTNSLPAHSPFTPSTPINEVVLIYNPASDTVDLKYQLSYEVSGESVLESANTGSIDL